MAIKVDREEFLRQLQMVQPGLSQRELIQQSDCFIFHKGQLITYNDEVACVTPCDVAKKFSGAVPAQRMLLILSKLKDDELSIEAEADALVFLGKRKRTKIRRHQDIELNIDLLERPGSESWKPLHEDFVEAISMACTCPAKDPSEFALTYVHIAPTFVEATDRIQFTRYLCPTPIKRDVLVKPQSIQHVAELGATEIAVTKSWMHFRSPNNLTLSCRRYLDEYPDLAKKMSLKVKGGRPMSLPKSLELSTECANIFSSEDVDNNHVKVLIKSGKIRVRGEGSTGEHVEWKNLNYKGPSLEFAIHPKLLGDFVKKYNECQITDDRLVVENAKFIYQTSFHVPEATTNAEG